MECLLYYYELQHPTENQLPIGGELGLTLYNIVQDFKGPDMILSQHQLDLRKEVMAG